MKRSEINHLVLSAKACFEAHGWTLPPMPRWDVTDFGLGSWRDFGLVLVNLAEEPEYCEKLMYARRGMVTPAHTHHLKKEDIICRWGILDITVWNGDPASDRSMTLKINGEPRLVEAGGLIRLAAGERVTLIPGIYHQFTPSSAECIIGEVSTANDDVNDNIFWDTDVGRFSAIEEDEPPLMRLVNE